MPAREPTPADSQSLAGRNSELRPGEMHLVSGPAGAPDGIVSIVQKPFESKLLGLKVAEIGRLQAFAGSADLPNLIRSALARLREEKFDYVAARRDERDVEAIYALQAGGLNVVECLITLRSELSGAAEFAADRRVAVATASDAEGVSAVGGASFTQDRFHADHRIDKQAADRLKATWARNAVIGRADKVFISRDGDRITGFNACLVRHGQAIIDLIGIVPCYQGGGLGRALMQAAMAHYAGKVSGMFVGTQSRNVASLALYTSLGFRVHGSAFTLSTHLS